MKAFDWVHHNKLWKILRDGNTRSSYLSSEKLQVGQKEQLKTFIEQPNGSKLGKDYDKAVYCYPIHLAYM